MLDASRSISPSSLLVRCGKAKRAEKAMHMCRGKGRRVTVKERREAAAWCGRRSAVAAQKPSAQVIR